ncbi:MAG: hypothetical protein HC848_10480 [Limnobacter sp.]|nr:hypothetical protein [Limnobacter sp.]
MPGTAPTDSKESFEELSTVSVKDIPEGGNNGGSGTTGANEETDTVLVAVYDGKVVVTNGLDQEPLEVNRGQGAYLRIGGPSRPVLLQAPPDVLAKDNTLSAPPFVAPQCAP